jgi:hypothetical protein
LAKRKQDAGKPIASNEVVKLIKRIFNDNPMRGIPHIHDKMLNLGYEISESTAMRYMPNMKDNSTGQSWKSVPTEGILFSLS